MTLPRLYLPRTLEKGDLCLATADQARYLKTVLRLREGDPVLIFNGTGREYDAIIGGIRRNGWNWKLPAAGSTTPMGFV